MNLQNIILPQMDLCNIKKMYYRCKSRIIQDDNNVLIIPPFSSVKFNTYFNSFSVDKWKKYTIVETVNLNVELKGDFIVTLLCEEKIGTEIIKHILLKKECHAQNVEQFIFEFPKEVLGVLYFKLETLGNQSEFWGGYYDCNIDNHKMQKVKIGIDICTFRRETFIEKNLEILKKCFLNNPNSPLYGNLEVFITDNGKTLDIDALSDSSIHIVKNKNTGGAGGFTRGLIEILDANASGNAITHTIVMDDDILINPESLLKTYNILMLLKAKYKSAFIGGAMLRNDKQNIQVENGAVWNGGNLDSLKANLDMSNFEACIYNEKEESTEFNAWWYCCIPISIVTYNNLPLPLFIRGDDVEYGLRNIEHLILINGICVWHEPFENKYSSFLHYYILRNQLIDNALHFPQYGKKELKKQIFNNVAHELVFYRYRNIDLIFQGVKDFLKGVDFFLETDGEKLHQEIMTSSYKAISIEDLNVLFSYPKYDYSMVENDENKRKRRFRFLTLNGYLLPCNRQVVVSMSKIRPINTYRAKKILHYDVVTQKGYTTERDFKTMVASLRNLVKLNLLIDKKYEKVKKDYKRRCKEIQNVAFWKKYLEIGGEGIEKKH